MLGCIRCASDVFDDTHICVLPFNVFKQTDNAIWVVLGDLSKLSIVIVQLNSLGLTVDSGDMYKS